MFTGLITDIGTIERVADSAAGRELRVQCSFSDLADGESIALNGVCLTVREHGAGVFTVAAVETTLAVTAIGPHAQPSTSVSHMIQPVVSSIARTERRSEEPT